MPTSAQRARALKCHPDAQIRLTDDTRVFHLDHMPESRRLPVREGYDLWSTAYDTTDNPVVALDARETMRILAPIEGETVLDAGCGTGRNLRAIAAAGCPAVGVDFSMGMLSVARSLLPGIPLVCADISHPLPLDAGSFDAALCALIGEHIDDLTALFGALAEALRPGGRLVFSVYHPELAFDGKEANFTTEGVEYRLGAVRHTVEDYEEAMAGAGFEKLRRRVFKGDEALAAVAKSARRYVGRNLLLVLEGRKPV